MKTNRTECGDVDECETGASDCDPNARCINNPGSYECVCSDGFTGNGFTCKDVNECLINNGGCDENAQCINTIGSFKVNIQNWEVDDAQMANSSPLTHSVSHISKIRKFKKTRFLFLKFSFCWGKMLIFIFSTFFRKMI